MKLFRKYHAISRSATAVICLLLSSPAWAQSLGEATGVDAMLGISPSTSDFVKEAGASGLFEIDSSKLAEDKGNAPEKSFAVQMINDHTRIDNELKHLVGAGELKADLPTAPDDAQQAKLGKLKSDSGTDFSSDFNSYQVSAHKNAVSLFERYAKGGDDSDLRQWAGQTLPTLRHHLQMAENLTK